MERDPKSLIMHSLKRRRKELSSHESVTTSNARQAFIAQHFHAPLSKDRLDFHHRQVLNFIISSNSAFRIVEDPEFKILLTQLNPSYKVPCRSTITDSLLTRKYHEILLQNIDEMKELENITLATDGWTDVSKSSIYATLALTGGKAEYILDISHFTNRPTAINSTIMLDKVILACSLNPRKQIRGIVTGNPSSMVATRRLFCEKYPGIVPIGCVLHVLNNLTKDIAKIPEVQRVFKRINNWLLFLIGLTIGLKS